MYAATEDRRSVSRLNNVYPKKTINIIYKNRRHIENIEKT